MITPRIKARITIMITFLLCVILAPTFSPIGVMEISAPKVKSIIPTITSTAPRRKLSKILGERGTSKKLKTRTMQMIGTTATIASCIFSCIFGFQNFKRSPSFPITKKARAKPERPMLEAPDFQCRHFRYVNILSICQTSKKKTFYHK